MKKMTLVALLISACTLGVFAKGRKPIAFKDLPNVVQEEVKKNFTEEQIQFITAKKELGRYHYTFRLNDETKFVYDNKAQLRLIETEQGVNEIFVPEKISKYINEKLPNTTITKYKRESGCQKVDLNDKMTLVFSKKGKFLRIDD